MVTIGSSSVDLHRDPLAIREPDQAPATRSWGSTRSLRGDHAAGLQPAEVEQVPHERIEPVG